MRCLTLAVALLAASLPVGAAPAVLLDPFEDAAAWQPREDGGRPPTFQRETARVREGQAALRLRYRNGASGWGNLQRTLAWPGGNGSLALWIYKERADPEAALHLWLEEPDGDLWVAPVLEAGAVLGRWAEGWHHLTIPLAAFRFDGRGNRRQERDRVHRLLLGCNFGDFDAVVDSLSFLPAGEAAPPAAEPTLERTLVPLGDTRPEVEALLGAGWYAGEGATLGRWTGRDGRPAEVRLSLPARRDAFVTFRGRIPLPQWQGDRTVRVTLDGRPVADVRVDVEGGSIRVHLPAAPAARRATLTLVTGSFVPAETGESADTRALGMKLVAMEVVTFPPVEAGPVARGRQGSVAILRDDLPRVGAPSDPEHLGRLLRAAGYGVTFVRALDLLNPLYLTRANFDLLVLPYGASYPAAGKEALVEYLRGGGAFFATGGYAFNNPLVLHADRWVDRDTYLTAFDTRYVDVGAPGDDPFLFGDWHARESGHWEWGGAADATTKRWTGARAGIHLALSPDKAYTLKVSMAYRAVTGRPPDASPSSGGEGEPVAGLLPVRGRVLFNGEALGEYAGTEGTAVLEFAIPKGKARKGKPSELLLETETWSPARLFGVGDDRQLGVAVNWVKAIPEGVSEADLEPPVAGFDVQINTARGNPRDALELQPEQIGAFDPSYRLLDAVRAVASPGQQVVPARLRLDGPFEGYAAAGLFGSNSAVFPRGYARWIRLLDAQDADGRHRGALGALALHYDGPFAGSGWAFFGVTNRDLFAPSHPAMGRVFLATVEALLRRTFLHGLGTEWACYRQGEAVKATVTVRNAGSRPRQVQVRFALEAAPPAPRERGES
ncbi:MAG: hypothetical protein GX774_12445, partial [Armatimonadetes bacterium]|nr:hypothetical protein [Armatimonadota bacterium]